MAIRMCTANVKFEFKSSFHARHLLCMRPCISNNTRQTDTVCTRTLLNVDTLVALTILSIEKQHRTDSCCGRCNPSRWCVLCVTIAAWRLLCRMWSIWWRTIFQYELVGDAPRMDRSTARDGSLLLHTDIGEERTCVERKYLPKSSQTDNFSEFESNMAMKHST